MKKNLERLEKLSFAELYNVYKFLKEVIETVDGDEKKIMDERIKKRAALYMLIKLVDENNGSISINTEEVKRVFSTTTTQEYGCNPRKGHKA